MSFSNSGDRLNWSLKDYFMLVVSTHLKNISQIGNLPQVGVKIKNIWNHHLDFMWTMIFSNSPSLRIIGPSHRGVCIAGFWANHQSWDGIIDSEKKGCTSISLKTLYQCVSHCCDTVVIIESWNHLKPLHVHFFYLRFALRWLETKKQSSPNGGLFTLICPP